MIAPAVRAGIVSGSVPSVSHQNPTNRGNETSKVPTVVAAGGLYVLFFAGLSWRLIVPLVLAAALAKSR